MSLPRAEALTHTDVEAIVRAVLQRLRRNDATNAADANVARRSASVFPAGAPSVSADNALRLDQRLVALEHLRDHWNGLRVLQVPASCVITPAAIDELRQRGVALQRFTADASNATHTGAAVATQLLVLAPHNQHASLARQLTGHEIKLQSLNGDLLASDLTDLQHHLSSSDRYALWCTPRPFAAIAHIASELKTAAVQLPVLEDLPRAVDQAQPKLIVVDSTRWHAAAISQLVRNWTRSFAQS